MMHLTYHLATRERLKLQDIRNEFNRAAAFHDEFFKIHDGLALGLYPWPKRPLYEWSRRLEYPWIISKIRRGVYRRILDAGSGVTFLPYHLASEFDIEVDCVDSDPGYAMRFDELNKMYDTQGRIRYHCHDITRLLPFESASFDCVICVSVVEHLDPELRTYAVRSLLDMVAVGGKLLLTIDVALDHDHEGVPLLELDSFVATLVADQSISIACDTISDDKLLTQRSSFARCLPYREAGKMYHSDLLLGFERWRQKRKNFLQLACALIEISR